MKLLKAVKEGEVITFKHSGSVTYKIDAKKGVVVPDDHAELIKERLGSQVSVADTDKAPTIAPAPRATRSAGAVVAPPKEEDNDEEIEGGGEEGDGEVEGGEGEPSADKQKKEGEE